MLALAGRYSLVPLQDILYELPEHEFVGTGAGLRVSLYLVEGTVRI